MTQTGGKLVTIFGGSGFIGTQLVQALARRGYRIRVAVRRPDLAGHVRMFGFPGQIHPVQANLRFPQSVERAVDGADIVVNLVGILFERGGQRFDAVQVGGARTVAQAAQRAGATRLVHMSAIGASETSPSAYARAKARGEKEVLKAFPQAVIVRPSLVFGAHDGFFNLFGFLARISPVLPVISGDTRIQPVYVGDVAEALALAVEGGAKPGTVYELGGPEIITVRQAMEAVLAETRRKRVLLPVPSGLAGALAHITGLLPRPLLTPDQVRQLGIENVVSGPSIKAGHTLEGLGITPVSMHAILPTYLWRFRRHGEFDRHIAA